MVLDPTLDLTPVVGNEGFQQLPDYLDITPTQSAPAADTGSEIAPPPQKQADTDWADISTKVFTAMREEVPAVPTSSSFFERFEGVTDIVGKPIDKIMDVLSLPADVTERGIGMAAGLFYWNDVDLATRWQLGQLTYESALGGAPTDEIMKRIHAGEDPEKVINDYEGGWADMLTKLALDPLNLFGVPGAGLAAKAFPKGGAIANALETAGRGITAAHINNWLGSGVILRSDPHAPLISQSMVDDLLMHQARNATAIKELEANPAGSITRLLDDGTPYQVDVVSELNRLYDEQDMVSKSKAAIEAALSGGLTLEDAVITDPVRKAPLVARIVNKLGFAEGDDTRKLERLKEAFDVFKRSTYSSDELRSMGSKWFAKPTSWLRGLFEQTIESKRNMMGHSFMQNIQEVAGSENDWGTIRSYMDEAFSGIIDGSLVANHPMFKLASDGTRFDRPASLMGITAIGDWAQKTGHVVDDFDSLKKPWFVGTSDEWAALGADVQQKVFGGAANKEQWVSMFLKDMHDIIGHTDKPGAFDLFSGMASVGDAGKVVKPELTNAQIAKEAADKVHGQVKNAMSIFWLNTPRYAITNAVSNNLRGIMASGSWRWDESFAQKMGKDLVDAASADPARLREVHVADKVAGKKNLKDWAIRPWVKMAADLPGIGDNPLRRKTTLLNARRFLQQHYLPESESSFGILKTLDLGDLPDDVATAVKNAYRESWADPAAFRRSLANGEVTTQPFHHLYNLAMDSLGIQGDARWLHRDLPGEDLVKQVDDAFRASKTPEEFVRNFSKITSKQIEFTSSFLPVETITNMGIRGGTLAEYRLVEEKQILQYEHERMALMGRVVEMRGQNSKFLKDSVQAHILEQQKRQKALFEKIDIELPNDLEGATALRAKEMAAYDRWVDQSWAQLTKKLRAHYGANDSEIAKFFDSVNVDRINTAKGHRAYRNGLWKEIDKKLDNGRHDIGAKTYFEQMHANRAKVWDEHFTRIAAPFGISRLPKAAAVEGDYAHTFGEGYVRMHEDMTKVLSEMQKHARSLFTEGGLKKGYALTPEQSKLLLSQLDGLEENASLAKGMALKFGSMMTDHAFLNYSLKYGIDDTLKAFFPYHFWPSRMAHRYFRAAMARPGAAGAFGVLVKGQYDITEGMPDRFKGKIGLPIPFLPDWMGGGIYVDPIKMLFPFAQGIDPSIGDEESAIGRVDAWMSSVGAGAAPWITMPLQMVGAYGERDKWIRYQMMGMPFGLPGTAAQQAISHFLLGDSPSEYDGELSQDDIRTITLGEALPEPRIRELLGIPPGDAWDYYRVLRMLASMAGDGTVTAEAAMRAAKDRSGPVWDQAKSQAATENGIRVLSSWAFGLPGTIYPKGEEIQNGLDAMFRVARESDRKGGSDGNIATFFDAFPEYQVRQIQKSFYRGKEELDSEVDTNLYYIDLNKIQEQYDPEIDYYEKAKAATPKGQRKDVSNILESLYEQRRKGINDLKIRYAKRKLTPSVYANPYDRALSMLREQYYNVDGDTIQSRQGAQLLFLQKLTGKGMEGGYYKLGQEADRIIEEYDAKIAGASNNERDDLYRARTQAIESLTSKALAEISVQDFLAYLDKRKREPSDEEAKRQQASDALRTFFHAPQEARSAVFMKYPTLATVYGQNPTEELAGALDAWWANYDRLTPNSVARDDYVQSTAGKLNAIREALGMKPMQPRQRASAAPFTANVDPYIMSLVEAGMPEEKKSLVKTVERDNEGLITKITESYE